ncbi:MAG: hypothetical protein ACOVJ6_12850, partial [Pirellulales bacterium]
MESHATPRAQARQIARCRGGFRAQETLFSAEKTQTVCALEAQVGRWRQASSSGVSASPNRATFIPIRC